jgi:hypothetical protein
MKTINRTLGLGLMLLLLAVAAPAMATEAPDDSAETTETTVAPVQIAEGDQPAVVAPPIEEGSTDHPWTTRFLYPLIVVGTFVLIIGIAIGYQRSVRRKYKVVS